MIDDEGRSAFGRLTCYGCDRELIPVLGATREHHFRHKVDTEGICVPETYLHSLAKQRFEECYRAAVDQERPYYLTLAALRVCRRWEEQMDYVCVRSGGALRVDLTRYFDRVSVEAGIGGFVADVLLSSSQAERHMLVEFAVTHACEPEKIQSGLRILEVRVENEDALADLPHGLDSTLPSINLYNFKDQPPIEGACDKRCPAILTMFLVYKSGKSRLVSEHPERLAGIRAHNSIAHAHLVEGVEDGLANGYLAVDDGYRQEAEKAFADGAPIKCCSICRYAGFRTWEKPVFCKIKRVEVGVNEAASCDAYRPEIRS